MKRIVSVVLVLVMAFSLVACGAKEAPAANTPAAAPAAPAAPADTAAAPADAAYECPEMSWDFGHALADDTPTGQAAFKFAEVMSELSGGKITVNVYPACQLGSEGELIEATMLDNLDICIGSTATLGNSDPNWRIFDMPLIMRDYDDAYACMDSEFGVGMLDTMLENIHAKGLNYIDCGFTEIIQNSGEMKTPADLKGLNIRCMQSTGWLTALTSVGANPVQAATSEVYTMVQNGTVDGTANPVATFYTNSIYDVAKYLGRLYMWFTPVVLMMSGELWKSLDPEVQAWVVEAGNQADLCARETRATMEEFWLSEMEKAGTIVTTYTEEERQVWVDYFEENMYPQLVPEVISQDLFNGFLNSAKG